MSKLYLFNGANYLRHDVKRDAADAGYPLPIADNCPGLPATGVDAAMTGPG
jgi:hypothetical protein